MIYDQVLARRTFLLGTLAAGLTAGCSTQPTGGIFFSYSQSRAVTAISDAIIPDTDIPGAVAAKVPEFIDGLMEGWANAETKGRVQAALEAMEQLSKERFGLALGDANETQVSAVVSSFDARAFSASGTPDSDPAFAGYRELKAAILDGYFLSEIGATEAARYEAVPGAFIGCVPVDPIQTRVWATR